MESLKVASNSNPKKVAGALTGVLKEKKIVELHAVGAGAVNQGIKAIAIARDFVAPTGIDLICIPAFIEIKINEKEKTAIKFIVKQR